MILEKCVFSELIQLFFCESGNVIFRFIVWSTSIATIFCFVVFLKLNKANGTYDLHLRANIGDKVTKRPSNCRLVRHHDTLEFAGKEFDDVIEIRCNDIPGYYQKGVGEIGQKEDKTGKTIRVLSS